MTLRPIFFGLFFLLVQTIQAQKPVTTLQGRVLTIDNQPVVGASVTVSNQSAGATSDANGTFSLRVSPGRYVLQVSMVGMTTVEKAGTVKAGAVIDLGTVHLTSTDKQLAEVVVLGKNETTQLRQSGFAVTAIETKKFANTTLDLNQVLNQTTGVKIREEAGLGSNFTFSLNGLSGSAIKFFVDGIPMENFGNSLTLNNIPVNLVERMEVYKGVVPVSLGSDALGGAVNIVTSQKTRNYVDASYSYGSFNTHRAAVAGAYTHPTTGFTVRANGFFNHSDNDYVMRNNPDNGVTFQVVENGRFVNRDVRRFHDRYTSGMGQLEAGFVDRKWADAFLLGTLYSANHRQVQTGANADAPIGEATNDNTYRMHTLKYRKANFLLNGLSANAFATYGVDKSMVTDTASRLYNWDGSIRLTDNKAGEFGPKQLFHYTNTSWLSRLNLGYTFNDAHALNLNYSFNQTAREGYNELDPRSSNEARLFDKPNRLGKHITGVAYQANLFNARLTSSLFGKYYGYNVFSQYSAFISTTEGYTVAEKRIANSYIGYGIANQFKLTDAIGLKVSYEHAYRLPDAVEVFGDGLFVLANPDLKPEVSDNLNTGIYLSRQSGQHKLFLEASAFYRNATDFIYFTSLGRFSQYRNVGKARVTGLEGEVRYEYSSLFSAVVNATYQNARDVQEFVPNSQAKNVTYLNRLPNQPYLYGNLELSVGKDKLLGANSRTQLLWITQYVHDYFLSWEALGSKNSKSVIPTQLIHTASLTHSLQDGRYNVSLECRNLSNELAYDNFRLQKPGRIINVKLRYFLQN